MAKKRFSFSSITKVHSLVSKLCITLTQKQQSISIGPTLWKVSKQSEAMRTANYSPEVFSLAH